MKRAIPLLLAAAAGGVVVLLLVFATMVGGRASRSEFAASANALAGPPQQAPSVDSRARQLYESAAKVPLEPQKKGKAVARASSVPAPSEAKPDAELFGGADAKESGAEPGAGSPSAPTRAWFPETLLFEPLVATDAEGRASVSARVPDRLTSWRILALAHSRQGSQAGAVTSFLGTLPAYVDVVAPPFLMAGDEARIPVQAVNTTAEELTRPLHIGAEGGRVALSAGTVRLPPGGSRVEVASVSAPRPGLLVLKASLGDADAVLKTIPILPTGRPVEQRFGGTLAAPREIDLSGPSDLDPASARVRLLVYPGALALVRSELSTAGTRGGLTEDAYALSLAGRAGDLLRALGETPDAAVLKGLALVAGQRALRHARAASVEGAALLAEAAIANVDNPVVFRLAEQLAQQVAGAQRPDGTFSGATGWTVQRLLVTTADCVRALKANAGTPAGRQRAAAASVRASGAFERNLARVEDPYTAAAILAVGGVTGEAAETLRAKVRGAVQSNPDGSRVLPVAEGVVRADGFAPSVAEATALAALALQGDPKAPWRPDLGSALLGLYSPSSGWGDGRANLAALSAVTGLFKDKVPSDVKVALQMDGKDVAHGALDAARLREVMALEADAPGAAGAHRWTVRAEPAVPGLGYSLTLTSYVPWKAETTHDGLELAVSAPGHAQIGRPVEIALQVAAPAGMRLSVRHALPAGVQADAPSLAALVQSGAVESFRAEDGAVVLAVRALAPGEALSIGYRAVPTLAGALKSGASSVALADRPLVAFHVPPTTWVVK